MVSGSQTTEHTCNDYSGSNVRSFCSGRATQYSIVTDCNNESSCWVHYGTSIELRACQILMEQSTENTEICRIILAYRQYLFIAADIMVITNRKE